MCKSCNKKCKTHNALKSHIEQFHKGDFLDTCHICGKGLNTQEGMKAHKMAHEPEEKRWKCKKGCAVTFGSKKGELNHYNTSIVIRSKCLLVISARRIHSNLKATCQST